jgi:hypothetical protein
VETSLAFVGSFGGRISRFAQEWSRLTHDPWVLSSVSDGFRLVLPRKLSLDFFDNSVAIATLNCIEANTIIQTIVHDGFRFEKQ